MAEEFVNKELFGEFVKRMDDRFGAVDKRIEDGFAHMNELAEQRYNSINQRLADADKAREQDFVHVNQRFDDMNQRFDDMKESVNHRFNSLEKMMTWQNRITMGILLVILAAAIKYLFIPG